MAKARDKNSIQIECEIKKIEEEGQKQPIAEPDKKGETIKTEEVKRETKLTEENQAALVSLLALLPKLNVSEEVIDGALDLLIDKLKG